MAAKRNYKAIQERREQRARDLGFKGYADQRKLRAVAAKVTPGRSRAAVAARDVLALELKQATGRARRGEATSSFDILASPKWGALDVVQIQADFGTDAEIIGLLDRAFDASGGGRNPGQIPQSLIDEINQWLDDAGYDPGDYWAELYGGTT